MPEVKVTGQRVPSLGVALAGVTLIGLLVGLESFAALVFFLLEGVVALAVLTAAGLAGGWIGRWLGLKDAPWAERLILGAGLGIGFLPLLVLGLGSLGWLTRTAAFLLTGGLALAGLARLLLDPWEMGVIKSSRASAGADRSMAVAPPTLRQVETGNAALNWLWLLVCPFVAIMLLGACLPPGVLWREEGYGYDVLEYHLAVPKIFFEEGRITFLSNNVYSNFPLNSEMLSLLMMTLRGDPIEASFMAVTVNTGLALLFMAAAWLAGSRFSPRAGLLCGVLAGTTPWIAYLAGIAYTEVGMLALGLCALAAALRERPLVAGLLAGLACGYKYTAVPLVAFPISFVLLVSPTSWPHRVRHLLLYGCAALLTFSPWMARNIANTGNPFFPLAYSVFGDGSGTWDDEIHVTWQKIHGSAAAEHTDEPLLARAWARTGRDFRLGTATFLLAAIAAVRRRDRWTAALLAMLVVQAVIWLTATHLFARFATVMLLPMLVLAGRAVGDEHTREDVKPAPDPDEKAKPPPPVDSSPALWAGPEARKLALVQALAFILLVAGSGWNLYRLAGLYYDHTRVNRMPTRAYGRTDWFITGQWPGTQHWRAINSLPAGARIMLVGEARTFYSRRPCEYATVFNRQPLAEALEQMQDPTAVLGWLRERGVTHLLVHWAEIGRLGGTYGFPPVLMNPNLYAIMVGAGLKEIARFDYGQEDSMPYATLFEVPRS
ncbi:MAG: glycosyltransferase family 39 protein [Phycisphaerae bacterium]|nr:glycosyltransferase family 39 protein [Phycisphaerae bacterium]